MSSAFSREVVDGLLEMAGQHGLGLSGPAIGVVSQHCEVLCRWNQKMNLVGDWSVETAVFRHYGESLFLASMLGELWKEAVDFGSGAGFPGIGVLARFPDRAIHLAEVRLKRAAFLREATRGFGAVRVFGGDCEELPGGVDLVVSRAVDIGVVVRFASERGADCGILMSASDGDRWAGELGGLGWHCTVQAVPWRPEAVVFLGRRNQAHLGAKTL